MFPAVTRTLVQVWSCRNLKSAGWWLTVDYSVRCYSSGDPAVIDPEYAKILTRVTAFAVFYSLGIPMLFFYLAHRFRHCIACSTEGERMRHRALGWMYESFRAGREWWLVAELLRVLLLTSAIGFLAESCWMKIFVANLISFVFLVVFLFLVLLMFMLMLMPMPILMFMLCSCKFYVVLAYNVHTIHIVRKIL